MNDEKTANANSIEKKAKKHSSSLDGIINKFEALEGREKFALVTLFIFIFCFFGVYGGYQIHKKALKQQTIFDQKVGEYFWLRSQANNLSDVANSPDAQGGNDLSNKVSQIANGAGINNIQVAATGEKVQFSFEHSSQDFISRVLSEMRQQKVSFSRLYITQANNDAGYRVEAVVSF